MLLNTIKFQRSFPFLDPCTSSLIFEYPLLKSDATPGPALQLIYQICYVLSSLIIKCTGVRKGTEISASIQCTIIWKV